MTSLWGYDILVSSREGKRGTQNENLQRNRLQSNSQWGERCAISLSCTDRVYNVVGTQSYAQSYALTIIDTLTSCDEA